MNFTRKSVFVDNSRGDYGDGLKNLIAAVVNNIPGLSIQTVTTSSAATYSVTLNYKGLLFEVYNSSKLFVLKVGSSQGSAYCYAMAYRSVVSLMYSDEGVISFSITDVARSGDYYGNIVSIIPVEFKLSDGTTKELFWFKATLTYPDKIGNIPQFANNRAGLSLNLLVDPDSQTQYTFSISGKNNAPVQEAKGKSVAVPLTFSTAYGDVISYNIKGSSPMYCIYPGTVDTLKNYYPGTQIVYIGDVPYIGIDYEYFVRT